MNSDNANEDFTICEDCKNPIENCTVFAHSVGNAINVNVD